MRSLRSGSLRSGPSLESYRSLFLRGSECLVRLTKNHPTSSELDQTTLTLLFFHFAGNLKTKTKSNVLWPLYAFNARVRTKGLKRRAKPKVEPPILKSLRSLSLAAQIDVKPCFTFNSIGQKTAICWQALDSGEEN
ncbi:hypothetical protein KQX54_017594 [Cotesia glomerata]|uniref:Uncharacterized protein n=1 Tax=Cotesia glomerata TaxID=32391 RepID=A0AAV7ICX9_COTGL|nr:hypothetical protein KQX54_017594 [Cotesia glomerata]